MPEQVSANIAVVAVSYCCRCNCSESDSSGIASKIRALPTPSIGTHCRELQTCVCCRCSCSESKSSFVVCKVFFRSANATIGTHCRELHSCVCNRYSCSWSCSDPSVVAVRVLALPTPGIGTHFLDPQLRSPAQGILKYVLYTYV